MCGKWQNASPVIDKDTNKDKDKDKFVIAVYFRHCAILKYFTLCISMYSLMTICKA